MEPPTMSPEHEASGHGAAPAGLPGWLRWLLLAQWPATAPVPSLRKSAGLAVLVVLAGLAILRFDLTRGGPYHPFDNGHAILSLRMAFNWAHCGVYSRLSTEHDTALDAALRAPRDPVRPILASVVDAAGSLERYCATVTSPFQNNENGIMVLAAGYMALDPEISMRGLAVAWIWQTVPLLLIFCIALIATGQSLLFTLASFWVVMSLTMATASAALYSNYMLVPAFVLALIGGLALATQRGIQRRLGPFLALMLATGAVVGFVAVLRTNYGLICLLLAGAFVIFVSREVHPRRAVAAVVTTLALLAVLAGQRVTVQLVNGPILALGLDYNSVHHPIAHPLVLALGQLESPLATREGIRWDDSVGLPLAQKIEPRATYLGPAYEKALLSYYAKLWIFHPGEMLEIYLAKWHESVRGSFGTLKTSVSPLARALAAPNVMARDGILWFFFALLAMAASWRWRSRLQPGAASGAFLLLLMGWLLGVEQSLLLTVTNVAYYAPLVVVVCLVGMVGWQALMNVLVRAGSRLLAGRSARAVEA